MKILFNFLHAKSRKTVQLLSLCKALQSFAKDDSHLELLPTEFQKRFRDFSSFEHPFALFSAPFTFDVPKAEESQRMELLEMQPDSSLRARYFEVGIPYFFCYLPERYINFRKFATRIVSMCGYTYLCEQLFSLMK